MVKTIAALEDVFSDPVKHAQMEQLMTDYDRWSEKGGVLNKIIYQHLKETKFRFNHRHDNVYIEILNILRNQPI